MTRFEKNSPAPTPTSLYYYRDSTVHTTINVLCTVFSSLLSTMTIFILYFIRSPLARLGSIVAFTLLFSAVLSLVARARRVDCFAASTAYVLSSKPSCAFMHEVFLLHLFSTKQLPCRALPHSNLVPTKPLCCPPLPDLHHQYSCPQ